MLSLYIHIPFCRQKCAYCSFYSIPFSPEEKETLFSQYLESLSQELSYYGTLLEKPNLHTLYIGGGTPNLLGAEELAHLVEYIGQYFGLEDLAELSIEMNPFPQDEIISLVTTLQRTWKDFPRIRFSFGIQTFDTVILQEAGRPCSFPGLVDFLRTLREIKQENTVYNLDFIAFGKFGKTRTGVPQLWDAGKLDFFSRLVHSYSFDSFSLYTLELFPGSRWQSLTPDEAISGAHYGTNEDISEEFHILKSIIMDAGYQRYEISNFALAGKSSIHNRVYREMKNYLGLGPSASSFLSSDQPYLAKLGLNNSPAGIRFTAPKDINEYREYITKLPADHTLLTDKDILIEEFFLRLRTDNGLSDWKKFIPILVDHAEALITQYIKTGFLHLSPTGHLSLTDEGMNVFHTIATELLKEV